MDSGICWRNGKSGGFSSSMKFVYYIILYQDTLIA